MQTEHWMLSWLAQSECHRLQWIRGVSVSMKQASCSPEPNRLVTMLIVCKTLLRSPSSVQRFGDVIQHPLAWLNQVFLLTLPVSCSIYFFPKHKWLSLTLSGFPMWNISLCWLAEGKKNKRPVPHRDSSKSKGSHVLVVFYCLCVLKSFSVCILWNAFLHHASSMLLSLPPSCFQL